MSSIQSSFKSCWTACSRFVFNQLSTITSFLSELRDRISRTWSRLPESPVLVQYGPQAATTDRERVSSAGHTNAVELGNMSSCTKVHGEAGMPRIGLSRVPKDVLSAATPSKPRESMDMMSLGEALRESSPASERESVDITEARAVEATSMV